MESTQANSQKQIVTTAEFNAKFRSKNEVYRFLAFECGVYLPAYATITIWHLRDIAAGKRKHIKSTAVKTIQVPHFEGLSFDSMLHNAKKHPGLINYLPAEEREIEKLPRAYLANLIYTIVGERFRDWVKEKVDHRTQKILEDQDMAIEMDPEILQVFKASN